jgi:sarcosine oxidase
MLARSLAYGATVPRYDVVVAGLGAMGAATTLALARSGASVAGFDAHHPPHELGSSHGRTRITRRSVAEGDVYVPLVARSHQRWRELESEHDAELFVECGVLVLGDASGGSHHGRIDFTQATKALADRHGIDHEMLTGDDVRGRFPAMAAPDTDAYFEPQGGYLRTEACVTAMLDASVRRGAALHYDEAVTSWSATPGGYRVDTTAGAYDAGRLVLCVGPWIAELVPALARTCSVQRQVTHWLAIDGALAYEPLAALPVYLWFHGPGDDDWFYGFPAVDGADGGVKVATERYGAATTPASVVRTVEGSAPRAVFDAHVAGRLLGVTPVALRSSVCLYTVTPDFGFVLDSLPSDHGVLVVSACSGHGFKHAPAIGECAAALSLDAPPPFDVGAFSLSRFA